MFKLQYTRYIKSKFTLFTTAAILLLAVVDKTTFGIYYFDNTIVRFGEFYLLLWYAASGFFGVFLCGRLVRDIQSNYLSIIICRIPFRKYLASTLCAGAAYMTTITGGSLLVLLAFYKQAQVVNTSPPTIALLSLIVLFVLFLVLVITLCSLLGICIKNRYVLQALPFVLAFGIPVAAFTIFSLCPPLGKGIETLSFYAALDYCLLWLNGYHYGLHTFAFPIVSIPLIGILYILNIRKFDKAVII